MPSFYRFVAALPLCLFLLAGCAPTGPYVWARDIPKQPGGSVSRILRPGDRLQVVVHGQETMSGEFEVRPGGEVILPVSGQFQAAGLSVRQLTDEVLKRLSGVLNTPHVTIVIASRRTIAVSVLGEVRTPGRYELTDSEGVVDALARAGGLTVFADDSAIFVVRRHPPGPRIRFRFSDLAGASASSLAFELTQGDIVVVE
jgi:polysaccharide export outer membrane protein